jgi:hypothetical protein
MHAHTAGRGMDSTLHVNTAGCGNGCTMHAHTAGRVMDSTLQCCTSILLAVEMDAPCTSIQLLLLVVKGILITHSVHAQTAGNEKLKSDTIHLARPYIDSC